MLVGGRSEQETNVNNTTISSFASTARRPTVILYTVVSSAYLPCRELFFLVATDTSRDKGDILHEAAQKGETWT